MAVVRPQEGETAASLLCKLVGKYVILNVTTSGEKTSVCVNIERSGSATWRRKKKDKRLKRNLDWPGFSLTPDSLIFSYNDLNAYANSFQRIREAFPEAAHGPNGKVVIGKLPQDKSEMGCVLEVLESLSGRILEIDASHSLSLNTPMYSIRRALSHKVTLMNGDELAEYAHRVLEAFVESQQIYAGLPELTGFGTDNVRGHKRPGPRDQLLRWYMQHKPKNPLGVTPAIDYVEYEVKPLNISDRLRWTCSSDPRTESIDDLLALSGSPVFTEVKMRGDRLVSHAVVQLLYYASIMANQCQTVRLNREIREFPSTDRWLCVIVEERASADEPYFDSDLEQALAFVSHETTKAILAPHYSGFVILVIRELDGPFGLDKGEEVPEFRVIEGGEHFIHFQ